MSKGRFITFEGIEGSGKSTQIRLLADRISHAGLPVDVTREPGGTELGEAIRSLLLAENGSQADPRTQALLHTAARAEHVARRITPNVQRGVHVLSDRFYDSTLAYQGGGLGLPIEELQMLQHFAIDSCQPDLRILLVIDPAAQLVQRLQRRQNRNWIDNSSVDFHRRVQAVFQQLASNEPSKWLVIDGSRSIDAIAAEIAEAVKDRFPEFSSI